MTTKDRVLAELEGEPEGLSKRELINRIGANPGLIRGILDRLQLDGAVTVTEEEREYGPTKICRATRKETT